MGSGIPEPIDFKFWGTLLFVFVGCPLIIATFVYIRFYAPCSWWKGSGITEVPMRCVEELRKSDGEEVRP